MKTHIEHNTKMCSEGENREEVRVRQERQGGVRGGGGGRVIGKRK